MTLQKTISLEIDENIAMDIEQLLNGGFYPLKSFMNYEVLENVLKKMCLPTGEIWPIPILFPKFFKQEVKTGTQLLLKHKGKNLATMKISDIFQYDLKKIAKSFFGTLNSDHPGVHQLLSSPNIFLSGILSRKNSLSNIMKIKALDPNETKKIIKNKKWKKIVGFHTRNPPHRAHEYLHKVTLENADGLLIHPVVGSKKSGDFSNPAIMASYRNYVNNYLPKNNVVLTPLLTYSRYGGPKEAVFTALVRRNYGCTHFIIGRDHTGVKKFYGKFDSQKIFKKLNDVGIKILKFDEPFYCKKCEQITTNKTCPHDKKYYVEISGTIIRQAIKNNTDISEVYIRNEVFKELLTMKKIFVK